MDPTLEVVNENVIAYQDMPGLGDDPHAYLERFLLAFLL